MDSADLSEASSNVRRAITYAGRGLIERETLIELIALAAVAGEHMLVIGLPGTAKSEAVRRVARATGAGYFEYLLGRFTEPSEIFGPVDLRKLKEGLVETETTGMLPEAEFAFLDEIFQGSTAILNTLLGILNERVFRRGHTQMKCPLRVCIGASNALPDDEVLAAFADRFLVRIFIDPIPDTRLEELLSGGWELGQNNGHNGSVDLRSDDAIAALKDIETLSVSARRADLSRLRPLLADAVRSLRGVGIVLSDRRVVKAQILIAAAAALTGRTKPDERDLWPLVFVVPTREQQTLARESLPDLLARTENPTLPAAAEEASMGPIARATRIANFGRTFLSERPYDPSTEAQMSWRLKLEGVAREIDAGFAAEQLPAELAEIRKQIVAALGNSGTDI